MSNITTDLRAALDAALPDLAAGQAQAARALLAALAPPIEEPTWPGAPVIAGCNPSGVPCLHIRRNWGPDSESGWECDYCITAWRLLGGPRLLTPAEYAEYGIPEPCTHGAQDFRGAGQ